jgi:hypothetical protein
MTREKDVFSMVADFDVLEWLGDYVDVSIDRLHQVNGILID